MSLTKSQLPDFHSSFFCSMSSAKPISDWNLNDLFSNIAIAVFWLKPFLLDVLSETVISDWPVKDVLSKIAIAGFWLNHFLQHVLSKTTISDWKLKDIFSKLARPGFACVCAYFASFPEKCFDLFGVFWIHFFVTVVSRKIVEGLRGPRFTKNMLLICPEENNDFI